MNEHVIELLQVPARLVGYAEAGLGSGFEAPALLGLGLLALLGLYVARRDTTVALAAVPPLTAPTAPSVPWEGAAEGAMAKVLDSSDRRPAALRVATPGGGE